MTLFFYLNLRASVASLYVSILSCLWAFVCLLYFFFPCSLLFFFSLFFPPCVSFVCIATEDVVQRKLLWEAVEGRAYNSVLLEMNSVLEDSITKEVYVKEGETFHLWVVSSQSPEIKKINKTMGSPGTSFS